MVALCEGEIDAITATVCGFPAVGISGANAWEEHFREPFLGFETVYLFADGDDAGMSAMGKLARVIPNARVIPSEPGEDVNSEFLRYGADVLVRKVQQ